MYGATRGMLLDRVFTIRQANLFEPHSYRHVVGPIRVKSDVEHDVAIVHSHFMVVRIMRSGETSLFATGRHLDRIDVSTSDLRFTEPFVGLDSENIDTLLAISL
jgi:anthranilate 1,2-dioxygenase small subunit